MNIQDTTIAKLQQLSELLLQEVNDFIDFIIHKYQGEISNSRSDEILIERWSQWFETVEKLDVSPSDSINNYQQLLINKYQQQGLEL